MQCAVNGRVPYSRSDQSPKCCRDHVDAARAGHLHCLQRLHEAEQFLDGYSLDREFAGEARRAEFWIAAHAACRAKHAHVLAWLFSRGCPPGFFDRHPFDLQFKDVPWGSAAYVRYHPDPKEARDAPKPPEWLLFREAMKNATPACLEVLLQAGFRSRLKELLRKARRSDWIDLAPSLFEEEDESEEEDEDEAPEESWEEEEEDYWILESGPRAGFWRRMYFSVQQGDLAVLQAVYCNRDGALLGPIVRTWRAPWGPLYARGEFPQSWAMCTVVKAAIQGGYLACLEALLQWYGQELRQGRWLESLAEAAAQYGQLACLQALPRECLRPPERIASAAAGRGHLACLRYVVELENDVLKSDRLHRAAINGGLDCVKFLHEAGVEWRCWDPSFAAGQGKPQILQYLLDLGEPASWHQAMEQAISANSPECMLLLMEGGLHQPEYLRMAGSAVRHESWRCAELLFESSKGILPAPVSPIAGLGVLTVFAPAFEGPIENLKMLAECFDWMPDIAAGSGDMRALQYVREIGAEWDGGTLRAAMKADSLACLRYAHEGGCPYELFLYEEGEGGGVEADDGDDDEDDDDDDDDIDMDDDDVDADDDGEFSYEEGSEGGDVEWWRSASEEVNASMGQEAKLRSAVAAESFPVLQYVHEHMDPAWAAAVLKLSALELQRLAKMYPEREIDWRMVHYLARHLGRKLPPLLGDVLAVRRGRAAALAGCVYRARRLAGQLASDLSQPMWAALAAVPSELWRQIAIDAQILLPEDGGNGRSP
eukprot:jgi/Botrbrau1/5324/Bobra.0391s0034.1